MNGKKAADIWPIGFFLIFLRMYIIIEERSVCEVLRSMLVDVEYIFCDIVDLKETAVNNAADLNPYRCQCLQNIWLVFHFHYFLLLLTLNAVRKFIQLISKEKSMNDSLFPVLSKNLIIIIIFIIIVLV